MLPRRSWQNEDGATRAAPNGVRRSARRKGGASRRPSGRGIHTGMSATVTADPWLVQELSALVPVALHGLAAMQDERTGLFSHKTVMRPDGQLENRGVNRLYTGASVVGLLASRAALVEPHRTQVRRALDALLQVGESDPAALATAVWAAALANRPEAPRLARQLSTLARPGRLSSMELGLALAGLARWLRVGEAEDRTAQAAARGLAAELERRYLPRARVFGATGARQSRSGRPDQFRQPGLSGARPVRAG
jgi:hypothetical protein